MVLRCRREVAVHLLQERFTLRLIDNIPRRPRVAAVRFQIIDHRIVVLTVQIDAPAQFTIRRLAHAFPIVGIDPPRRGGCRQHERHEHEWNREGQQTDG